MPEARHPVLQAARRVHGRVVALRRAIHAHPELGFEEFRTAALVARGLRGAGIACRTGVARTGIVAVIRGGHGGPCVALRADMDALPITEQTGLSFASKTRGVMHACGHDAHTAMLVGAGWILHELRASMRGTVKLLFQPSEERHPGGAAAMIDAGVLRAPAVEAIFGQHVLPRMRAGRVGFFAGAMMASADELYITIRGRGGHGAMPHLTVDPVVVAAQVILALQTVVSRRISPLAPGVLTIGKVAGGTTTNVIPDAVELVGTLRAMEERQRRRMHADIAQILAGVTAAAGASYTFRVSHGYPVLVNDAALTGAARTAAERLLGRANVFTAEPLMGAEDFAYFLREVPGSYYRLGVGRPGRATSPDIHTSRFTVDEAALVHGTAVLAHVARTYLEEHA